MVKNRILYLCEPGTSDMDIQEQSNQARTSLETSVFGSAELVACVEAFATCVSSTLGRGPHLNYRMDGQRQTEDSFRYIVFIMCPCSPHWKDAVVWKENAPLTVSSWHLHDNGEAYGEAYMFASLERCCYVERKCSFNCVQLASA
jgi:hypothetical protein